MPAGIREPDLPAGQAGIVRESIVFIDNRLRAIDPHRPVIVNQLAGAQPTQLLQMLRALIGELADMMQSFKNGSTVQRGSERTTWQGSRAAGVNAALKAQLVGAYGPAAAPVIDQACAAYDALMQRPEWHGAKMTKERFVAVSLASAGLLPQV